MRTPPAANRAVELHYLSGLDQLFVNALPGEVLRLHTGVFEVVAYHMRGGLAIGPRRDIVTIATGKGTDQVCMGQDLLLGQP
jgi:hypothetical protein